MLVRTLKLNLPFADYKPTETKLLQNKIFAISKGQIPQFKKHFIDDEGQKKENFDYPLVNFRSENGKGILYAINDGIEDLKLFYEKFNDKPYLKTAVPVNEWRETFHHVELSPKSHIYRITHCALFNSRNFDAYTKLPKGFLNELKKTEHIEGVLTNQIINFCNAINYLFPKGQLWLRVLDFEELGLIPFSTDNAEKGKVDFLIFDITFRTNISLPNEISLGKEKAIGWGITWKLE